MDQGKRMSTGRRNGMRKVKRQREKAHAGSTHYPSSLKVSDYIGVVCENGGL